MNCGDPMAHDSYEPDPEHVNALLWHIARYRLTVFTALERLPAFLTLGPRKIKAILRYSHRQSLIAAAPLYHSAKYWFLTASGALHCELESDRSGPLTELAKLRALAILQFCILSVRPRHRLTADDVARKFQLVYRPGLPDGYYFDPQDSGRLGLARVDAGRRGRWDRTVQSLREDIDDHIHQIGFRKLIQAGRFEITLLTILPQKARRIAGTLSQYRDTARVPLHIVALPQLLPLISPRLLKGGILPSRQKAPFSRVSSLPAQEHGKTMGNGPMQTVGGHDVQGNAVRRITGDNQYVPCPK